MKVVDIDITGIKNWKSFHDTFSSLFDFPDYYGMNMDAWIDCMDDLVNEPTLLDFGDCRNMNPAQLEIADSVLDCAAFVNLRKVERGSQPQLLVSLFK